jgi:MFS transporter, DHA1 family, inner membrane transport protein
VLSISLLLVTDYRWFLLINPLIGMLRNVAWLASQSYVTGAGSVAERPRLTGRFGFFSNIGQMLGPVLVGTAAGLVGYRLAFLVPAVYSAVFATLGWYLVEVPTADEDAISEPHGAGIRSAIGLLAVRGMQVALLLTFVRLWTGHVYSIFFSVFLVDNGLDPAVAGVVIGTSGFVAAAMSATSGFWTRFVTPQAATTMGLSCNAVALIIAPHTSALPFVFIVPVLIGIGTGLSLPLLISIVTLAAPDGKRGVALGLRGLVNQTAATAAPIMIGSMMTVLGLTLGFSAGGLVAGAVLAGAWMLDRSARRTASVTGRQ